MVLSEATHIDINRKKHKPDIAMLTVSLIGPAFCHYDSSQGVKLDIRSKK